MEARINSYIKTSKGVRIISLFGYSTRGIPGLEINGVGKLARSLREKITYLTKIRGLYLPKLKYSLCLDLDGLEGGESIEEIKTIEFPILLLYWYLGGLVPIKKLDDCLCEGLVSSRGEVFQSILDHKTILALEERFHKNHLDKIKSIGMHPNELNHI